MPSSRSKTIWDQSVSLSDYVAAEIVGDVQKTPPVAKRLRWQLPEYLFRIAEALFGQDRVPERIRVAIRLGDLIATGLRDAPSKSGDPVEIPPEQFLQGQFHILRNSVECDEFRYREIRLIAKAALSHLSLSTRPNQQPRQIEIRNVIHALDKSGRLDGKLRKQQIPIVRDALIAAGIKNIGSDKTIERLIRINSPAK